MSLMSILSRHTENSFTSIRILLETFNDDDFTETINGFPVWRQFYHMLNSIDRIFVDPVDYRYPEFHREGMNNIEIACEGGLDKETLFRYFERIEHAVRAYLSSVGESELFERSSHETIEMTRLDHILAQLRHIAWHIGYLHACAKVKYGRTPDHKLVE
jgi:hypothetical protein